VESAKYIGPDVHKETTSIAAMNSIGKSGRNCSVQIPLIAKAAEWWQSGWECDPLRHRVRHLHLRIGGWSIDGDACSGYCSLDLCYWLSDADGIEAGRPEFEIEHSFVGFSVGRDRVCFVVGEDG
jgi:hypothetical protein